MFGGYMLVYAATAKAGAFATEPWATLFSDAYTGSTASLNPLPYTNPLAPVSPPGVNPQFP